ncbi:hypothetical protein [uncultured Nostoc sp.]|uniref:hypothetical protein n=1 Tax=uncultured Nostoc sp. TaxID=340711 RepID=UPI0035CC604D
MIKLKIDIDWIIEVLKNYNELGELVIDMQSSKVILLSRDGEINDLDFEELVSGNPYIQILDCVCNFYPVDEQGNQLEFKSATTLKDELGLTSQQIKQLGEPDGIRKNPYFKNGHPMKLYSVDRIKKLFSIS